MLNRINDVKVSNIIYLFIVCLLVLSVVFSVIGSLNMNYELELLNVSLTSLIVCFILMLMHMIIVLIEEIYTEIKHKNK